MLSVCKSWFPRGSGQQFKVPTRFLGRTARLATLARSARLNSKSSAQFRITASQHRLAGGWNMFHPRHEVDIGASGDQDHLRPGPWNVTTATPRSPAVTLICRGEMTQKVVVILSGKIRCRVSPHDVCQGGTGRCQQEKDQRCSSRWPLVGIYRFHSRIRRAGPVYRRSCAVCWRPGYRQRWPRR